MTRRRTSCISTFERRWFGKQKLVRRGLRYPPVCQEMKCSTLSTIRIFRQRDTNCRRGSIECPSMKAVDKDMIDSSPWYRSCRYRSWGGISRDWTDNEDDEMGFRISGAQRSHLVSVKHMLKPQTALDVTTIYGGRVCHARGSQACEGINPPNPPDVTPPPPSQDRGD